MVERRNGAVVRDLTTEVTETGDVYVVAPVPASVKTAIKVTGSSPVAFSPRRTSSKHVGAHAAVGRHPDLTGNWSYTDWIGTT